jgi:hypothetical protein
MRTIRVLDDNGDYLSGINISQAYMNNRLVFVASTLKVKANSNISGLPGQSEIGTTLQMALYALREARRTIKPDEPALTQLVDVAVQCSIKDIENVLTRMGMRTP